eukprot:4181376-Amphidinium_carterae.1
MSLKAAAIGPPMDNSANATLLAKVVAARQDILGHDIFQNVLTDQALTIGTGGSRIEPYKKSAYQGCKAIAVASKPQILEPFYVSGFNIWKIDWLYLACPQVPINTSSLELLTAQYFEAPSYFPRPLKIGVQTVDADPSTAQGELRTASPEEMKLAWLLAVHRDLCQGKEAELREWKKIGESMPVEFHLVATEEDMH